MLHREIANRASEAGISINAFVKKALGEAVENAKLHTNQFVAGFNSFGPEPAMLMEPDGPRYGSKDQISFKIPAKDLHFARELAAKLGWEVL